jgi:hypothetical protein
MMDKDESMTAGYRMKLERKLDKVTRKKKKRRKRRTKKKERSSRQLEQRNLDMFLWGNGDE